jgi:hypothetical protein
MGLTLAQASLLAIPRKLLGAPQWRALFLYSGGKGERDGKTFPIWLGIAATALGAMAIFGASRGVAR